ncbi:hypothetical protein EVAR_72938_1 [Eumeta japonica]|uniref:Uncharacterized protein n=1 Tax=Eumeta variegata TaxID=151549 RepID=A0A4C1SZY4_EUMVA|nr:hypothetical protein EVAR_72938_1 [Eumeta japonica]
MLGTQVMSGPVEPQSTTTVLLEPHGSGVTGPGTGTYDPSVYAGYLTPEAFQQYLQQFTGAFGPYGYPGYGSTPVYPGPYAGQSGYDGFLVPTTGSTSLSASGTVSSNSGNSFITALTNLIPTLMDSTIFRVVITVIGAILMLLFGGAINNSYL